MKKLFPLILLSFVLLASIADAQNLNKAASKPLFRDPVFDGAADPVIVWNPSVKRWWMFYTNRRANAAGLSGVAWVHGTRIGIAESSDNGTTWKYLGTADIKLPESFGGKDVTHWAPDVIRGDDSQWHMFLTVVPGIFENWQHPRDIVQLTSKDLRTWDYSQTLELSSDRVIDAGLMKMPDGLWRMWYNNERDSKSIYYAESLDLKAWVDKGKAVADKPGEGPKVFRWKGKFWMIVDQWKGLGVYRSDDAINWEPQAQNLLAAPGKGVDDQVIGQHPDVVVCGERAYLFYFTHPGRTPDNARKDSAEQRRSSLQVVELKHENGWLACDRDAPTFVKLTPQKK